MSPLALYGVLAAMVLFGIAYDVVKESNGDERIICVFRSSDGRALQSQRPDKPAADNFNGTSSSTDADASEPVKLTVLE